MSTVPAQQYIEPEDAVRIHLRNAEDGPGTLLLAVAGTVDLLTSTQVSDAVTAALTRRPRVLVIDLSAVTFLDSTGLSVRAQAQASGPTTTVRVVAPEEGMLRSACE